MIDKIIEQLGDGEVKLIARSKVYMQNPFFVMAAQLSSGTFETGQHQDGSEATKDNLTYEEMIGKKPLSPEKAKKFPFVINPQNTYSYSHMDMFNLQDYADRAKLKLLLYTGKVATSKKEYNPRKHTHILQSEYLESHLLIKDADIEYEAMKLVMEANSDAQLDMAYLLNYYDEEFHLPSPNKVSPSHLKAKLIETAKKNPSSIITALSGNKDEKNMKVFIMRLVSKEIIKKEGVDFVFQNTLLGDSISKVMHYIQDDRNELIVQKWLNALDNPPQIKIEKKEEDVKPGEYIKEIQSLLFKKDIEKAKELYKEALKISPKYPKLLALGKAIEDYEVSERDPEPNTEDKQ